MIYLYILAKYDKPQLNSANCSSDIQTYLFLLEEDGQCIIVRITYSVSVRQGAYGSCLDYHTHSTVLRRLAYVGLITMHTECGLRSFFLRKTRQRVVLGDNNNNLFTTEVCTCYSEEEEEYNII